MRIEEGKQYLTRSGALVGPMEPTQFGEWRGWDGGAFIYELDGRHGDETDSVYGMIPNIPENDIISLAPGSAGQNGAHTPDLVEALSYTISCLVSLRKNYEERGLGLWEDVSKAITQGKSAIAAATGEAV